MNKEREFWDLIRQLQRNYEHGVHTYGSCMTNDCNNTARGSGLCADCCEEEIRKLIDNDFIAQSIHHHTCRSTEAIDDALEILK